MRYMLLLKGDPPAGAQPSRELIEAMTRFDREMADAGVLLASEGLHSSGIDSARVTCRDGARSVTDGPFAESKEPIAGFYVLDVASKEEAIAWASRCPAEAAVPPGQDAVIEVRRVAEFDDLTAMTDELMAEQLAIRGQRRL